MEIKSIIFDLGGILLNISYQATIDAFKKLGVKNFGEFFTQANQSHLFDRLDTGKISPAEFRNELRRLSGIENMKDDEIDQAWNAMILDIPPQRISMLEKVKQHYRTFLYSNTNAIHYPVYTRQIREIFGYDSLGAFFEQQYYSHILGKRKPDVESFEHILKENALNPSETLFFDDSVQHVDGARKAGMNAYWLNIEKEDIRDFFKDGKLNEDFFTKLELQTQHA
ncbi:MAG: HAD family hydrolase [Bacteroidales bacterium]